MRTSSDCPHCGKPLPAGLAGLCPVCLLAQGDETRPASAGRVPFGPLPVEEVARLFPQLEILSLLGAGGMGAVYKARQPHLDRWVALKILPPTAKAAGSSERFNREARALARLTHPNIVAVHEFGQVQGLNYFIMEFVDGANLRQMERAGRLSAREALQIIPQICDALQYAHDEGVVHRDIKPENVLVDRKGRVRIADFGLAKIQERTAETVRLTSEGQVMGTPHYMAPEQLERPLAVDHRADIYSLGVVFYEMLTGDLPLGKFAPPSRKVEVDVRLDEVVLRTLENDPGQRYQRVSEVKERVEHISQSGGISAGPVVPVAEPLRLFVRWAGVPLASEVAGRRRPYGYGIALLTALVAALLTWVFGSVSFLTGQTWFGWLGLQGWGSVAVRATVTAAVVVGLVAWALRTRKAAEQWAPAPRRVWLGGTEQTRPIVLAVITAALLLKGGLTLEVLRAWVGYGR